MRPDQIYGLDLEDVLNLLRNSLTTSTRLAWKGSTVLSLRETPKFKRII